MADTQKSNTSTIVIVGLCVVAFFAYRSQDHKPAADRAVAVKQGDLRNSGGSATVRRPFARREDDLSTSNDESNDQPLRHFGTKTLRVCSVSAGNCYTLDGDLSGSELERVYFPRGGWVDFVACELDEDLEGNCEDERGRSWRIDGEA